MQRRPWAYRIAFHYFCPMRIDIITGLPALLDGAFNTSIMKRAQDKGLVEIELHDLHEYSTLKHRRIDDEAYGIGAGMVMQVEPVHRCISMLQKKHDYTEVLYMSPDGELLDQPMANKMSSGGNLIILCGHYKGVDERIREHLITREVSIGNYVLTGGELPAAVLCDSVVRLLPGVLNDETSALSDSFQDGLLAPPAYTRPAEYNGWKVPDVLLSGNERAVEEWRMEQALERTRSRRPGLLGHDKESP